MKELVTQKNKKSILFLCTGNSCRSQIAEGLGKKYLHKYNISSAGTQAHGMNPFAIKTMLEIGIDISNQHSKKISQNHINNYDLVITLCGDAKDNCPNVGKIFKHIHWDIKDPASFNGSEKQKTAHFANIRDEIIKNIKSLRVNL